MHRIIIADSHAAIRNGLKKILCQEPDLLVQQEATSAYALSRCLKDSKPDLVLLDVSLPGETGIELLARLKKNHPSVLVVIMSMQTDAGAEKIFLEAGAAGFICKENLATGVVDIIRKALSGTVCQAELVTS